MAVAVVQNVIDCHVHLPATGPVDDALEILAREYADLPVDGMVLIDMEGKIVERLLSDTSFLDSDEMQVGVVPLATPDNLDLISELGSTVNGLKVHPRFQQVPVRSTFVDSAIECARRLHVPVVFDTLIQSSSLPLRAIEPGVYDDLAKENPDITFILAHACWPKLVDGYILARSNDNIYLDLSYFGVVGMGIGMILDFATLLATLDQKVLYGSDFPHVNPSAYLTEWGEALKHLDHTKRERIFSINAREVFGL